MTSPSASDADAPASLSSALYRRCQCPTFWVGHWVTTTLENAKLLMEHESDNKREVDKLIARAGGAIDLDNNKLVHARARTSVA